MGLYYENLTDNLLDIKLLWTKCIIFCPKVPKNFPPDMLAFKIREGLKNIQLDKFRTFNKKPKIIEKEEWVEVDFRHQKNETDNFKNLESWNNFCWVLKKKIALPDPNRHILFFGF